MATIIQEAWKSEEWVFLFAPNLYINVLCDNLYFCAFPFHFSLLAVMRFVTLNESAFKFAGSPEGKIIRSKEQ